MQGLKSKTITVPIDSLRLDPLLQCRQVILQETIVEYRDQLALGVEFPPVTAVRVDDELFLVDGFARRQAHIQANKTKIKVAVIDGDRQTAIEIACGANKTHGVRRTVADKRKAVALALETFPDRSSRELAVVCGVSHTFVDAQRKGAAAVPETPAAKAIKDVPPVDFPDDWKLEQAVEQVATLPPPVEKSGDPVVVANAPKGKQKAAKSDVVPAPEYKDFTPGCAVCGTNKHIFSDGGWACTECGQTMGEPIEESSLLLPEKFKAIQADLGRLIRSVEKAGVYAALQVELAAVVAKLKQLVA